MVILDLATALRCSELFALKWRDVLWDDLTLLVRRAIVTGIVSDVKTKYSCAGMPLDPGLADRGRQTAVVSVGSDTDRPFYKATTSLNTLALLDPLTENEGEERVQWWSRWDSNPRPPRCHRGALPTAPRPHRYRQSTFYNTRCQKGQTRAGNDVSGSWGLCRDHTDINQIVAFLHGRHRADEEHDA